MVEFHKLVEPLLMDEFDRNYLMVDQIFVVMSIETLDERYSMIKTIEHFSFLTDCRSIRWNGWMCSCSSRFEFFYRWFSICISCSQWLIIPKLRKSSNDWRKDKWSLTDPNCFVQYKDFPIPMTCVVQQNLNLNFEQMLSLRHLVVLDVVRQHKWFDLVDNQRE